MTRADEHLAIRLREAATAAFAPLEVYGFRLDPVRFGVWPGPHVVAANKGTAIYTEIDPYSGRLAVSIELAGSVPIRVEKLIPSLPAADWPLPRNPNRRVLRRRLDLIVQALRVQAPVLLTGGDTALGWVLDAVVQPVADDGSHRPSGAESSGPAPSDAMVERLRARSSRRDYASMARLATALYAKGLRPRDVLQRCYGVGFPAEFFATAVERLATPHLMATFTGQPWDLGVPPGQGGPPPSPTGTTEFAEQRIFDRDPDLVPLMELIGEGTNLRRTVICYRLTELRLGNTAVFGIDKKAAVRDQIVHCGQSLLTVLHQHHIEFLRHYEWEMRQPENWGADALSPRAVNEMRFLIGKVEALQRRVASPGSG
jgi:hypothetical protein